MNFERVLKEVLWCLVTEGGISYRRIRLNFGLDDDGLEELRRELIGIKRLAADVEGELTTRTCWLAQRLRSGIAARISTAPYHWSIVPSPSTPALRGVGFGAVLSGF